MLTIEEKIRQLEAIAESGDELYADYEEQGLQDTHGARRAKSLIEEKRQEIAWLRELQERRKASEIVRCGECRHRDPEDKKCDCGHDIIWQLPRDDDWYCADAERRTDEND